jgi:DNA-binding response OmpR family regulator
MNKLLIIEDDPAILKGLTVSLEQEHYEVHSSSDGIKGYEKAKNNKYDLIVLDLMLPGKNGQDICRDLRAAKINTPILMLTSKHEESDKVLGLELGADDYVTKPFSIRELQARVKAILRRGVSVKNELQTFEFADVQIDFKKQEALKNNESIKLSSKEFEILHFLIQHESEVVSRSRLLDEIWGYDVYPTTRTVDNFILNIRKKIEDDPAKPKHLITVHTSGYKFIKNYK